MKNLWLRRVNDADSDLLFEWINDPDTRRNSLNSAPIMRKEHDAWFERRKADSSCHHYMVMEGANAVGVVRLDGIEDSEGEYRVSINIAPEERGRGYGHEALLLLNNQACAEIPDAQILHAEIKISNTASKKSFEKAGYRLILTTGGDDPVSYLERSVDHSQMVYFRCDANSQIGSGHLMRCLTIADACRDKDVTPVFIMAQDDMEQVVRERGYVCTVLGTEYDKMHLEIPKLVTCVPDGAVVVIDSYQIGDSYIKGLAAHDYRIFLMNDGGDIRKDVDCLINYNISADKKEYPTSEMRCLIGPSYAPVRPSFCDFPFGVTESIRDILITTGASDPYHISLLLLQGLLQHSKNLQIQVICGKFCEDEELLLAAQKAYGGRVSVITGATDLSAYMRKADFVFAGSGSTVYELMAIGAPAAVFSFADNQLPIAEAYDTYFPGLNLGDIRKDAFLVTERAIQTLENLSTPFVRQDMSRRMQQIVDGGGAGRIADAIRDVVNS